MAPVKQNRLRNVLPSPLSVIILLPYIYKKHRHAKDHPAFMVR